jgi:hypothetical protein
MAAVAEDVRHHGDILPTDLPVPSPIPLPPLCLV